MEPPLSEEKRGATTQSFVGKFNEGIQRRMSKRKCERERERESFFCPVEL